MESEIVAMCLNLCVSYASHTQIELKVRFNAADGAGTSEFLLKPQCGMR